MTGPQRAHRVAVALAGLLLAALVLSLSANVILRLAGAPAAAPMVLAQWLLVPLALTAMPLLLPPSGPLGRRALARTVVGAFAAATLAAGASRAALSIGGTEPLIGWHLAWRYGLAAALCLGALALVPLAGVRAAVALVVGVLLAVVLPPLGPLFGVAAFALALTLRVPVALALVAAVAVSPDRLSDAALAQTLVRGLSPYVLLAVPLFILSAALMVAGGMGTRIVRAAEVLAGGRPGAAANANVLSSMLFGGVSGSSIADAAMNARLLAPGMVAAGASPANAAALTAASAVLPNVLPPSIALLLAAAATDQSVARLWIAGVGAGLVLAASLLLAVRLTTRSLSHAGAEPRPAGAEPRPVNEPATVGTGAPARANVGQALIGLVPVLAMAVAVLGALRVGLVTAVEAGLVAIALALAFALLECRGRRDLVRALMEAGAQSARVLLLIAAAAPVAFRLATSGPDPVGLLPTDGAMVALGAACLVCLAIGAVLDAGAAILLVLPSLLPLTVAAGADPIHATLVLTSALLMGGLTPPVGILVLVTQEVTGARSVYLAIWPYLAALLGGLSILLVWPALTAGLTQLI